MLKLWRGDLTESSSQAQCGLPKPRSREPTTGSLPSPSCGRESNLALSRQKSVHPGREEKTWQNSAKRRALALGATREPYLAVWPAFESEAQTAVVPCQAGSRYSPETMPASWLLLVAVLRPGFSELDVGGHPEEQIGAPWMYFRRVFLWLLSDPDDEALHSTFKPEGYMTTTAQLLNLLKC